MAAGAAAWQCPAAILGHDPDNFAELAQQDTQQLVNAHGAGSTVAYAAGDFNNLLQLNANSLEGFDFARDVQPIEPLMKIIMKNNYGLLAQGTKVVCLQLTLSDLDFDGMQSMLVRFDQPHQHYLRQWYDKGVLALVAKRCLAMRHATVYKVCLHFSKLTDIFCSLISLHTGSRGWVFPASLECYINLRVSPRWRGGRSPSTSASTSAKTLG